MFLINNPGKCTAKVVLLLFHIAWQEIYYGTVGRGFQYTQLLGTIRPGLTGLLKARSYRGSHGILGRFCVISQKSLDL